MHSYERRIFFAIVTGVLVLISIVSFFIATMIRNQKKKVSFHRAQTKTELSSIERDRTRIASDLHDDIGGSLSAIRLRLQCIETNPEKTWLILKESGIYLDDVMQKLRQISFNLMPQVLYRKGLFEALTELTERLSHSMQVKIHFEGEDLQVPDDKSIQIYRITQEIFNNILKHSNATKALVEVTNKSETLCVHINDNGIGFKQSSITPESKGDGMKNIVARVDILNAAMFLTTEPGKGADYIIEIPKTSWIHQQE